MGFLILALLGGYCQSVDVDQPVFVGESEQGTLLPVSGGERVVHTHFQLSYSELHEGALWVFYHLSPGMLEGDAVRKDNFRPDPKVSTFSAFPEDYVGTGYDRGHLCPAASMVMNQEAMDETFYMSNMSPQHPSLNRGRWKSLETKEREWTTLLDTLYIATGAVFSDSLGKIGANEVTIPRAYYKILWDGAQRIIGFIMPNEKCNEALEKYVVPVDSIELLTGIDFFSIIPDHLENEIESKADLIFWFNPVLSQQEKNQISSDQLVLPANR